MDNLQNTGHPIIEKAYAVVSVLTMLLGWITMANAQLILQMLATLVSIGAGAMVFYNNYKQSKKK